MSSSGWGFVEIYYSFGTMWGLDSYGLDMLLFWLEVFVYHVQVRRPFWWITSSIYTEIDGKVWQLEVYAVCYCNTMKFWACWAAIWLSVMSKICSYLGSWCGSQTMASLEEGVWLVSGVMLFSELFLQSTLLNQG